MVGQAWQQRCSGQPASGHLRAGIWPSPGVAAAAILVCKDRAAAHSLLVQAVKVERYFQLYKQDSEIMDVTFSPEPRVLPPAPSALQLQPQPEQQLQQPQICVDLCHDSPGQPPGNLPFASPAQVPSQPGTLATGPAATPVASTPLARPAQAARTSRQRQPQPQPANIRLPSTGVMRPSLGKASPSPAKVTGCTASPTQLGMRWQRATRNPGAGGRTLPVSTMAKVCSAQARDARQSCRLATPICTLSSTKASCL